MPATPGMRSTLSWANRQSRQSLFISGRRCAPRARMTAETDRAGNHRDPKADKYHQQSIVLVPSNTPGVKLVRPMSVFGYDDAPEGHYEVKYENVRVPASNLVLGWGRGFEIIQGRLGPGRLHHCMRSLGLASRSLDLALLRATDERKKTFGKSLFQHGKVVSDLAESRIEIDQSRLLVLAAALVVDKHPERAKGALREIGMAKVSLIPSFSSLFLRAVISGQRMYRLLTLSAVLPRPNRPAGARPVDGPPHHRPGNAAPRCRGYLPYVPIEPFSQRMC